MENENVVFLCTSSIFTTLLRCAVDLDDVKGLLEDGSCCYSTGKLERALAQGCRILVPTTRSKLFSHDEWWVALVGRENIFLVDPSTFEEECDRGLLYSTGWMAAFKL